MLGLRAWGVHVRVYGFETARKASWSARRAAQDYRAARDTAPRRLRAQVCCGARRCGRTVRRRSLRSRATRTVPTPSTNARGAVPRTAGVISLYPARCGTPRDTAIPLRVVWDRGVGGWDAGAGMGDCLDYRDRAASPSRSRPPTRRSRSRRRTPGPSRCAHTRRRSARLGQTVRGNALRRIVCRPAERVCACARGCVGVCVRVRVFVCVRVCVCARETQCSV